MNSYTIEDLVWAIEADKGQFSLKFARCNYQKLRDEMIQKLSQSCAITILKLEAEDLNLHHKIQELMRRETPEALMVYGFEEVENLPELLISTNNLREKFKDNFAFPIVLWVNDVILGQFEQLAKDFQNIGVTISFAVTVEGLLVDLEAKSERFFQQLIEVGGTYFLPNEVILGKSYRSELESAKKDLENLGQELSADLQKDFLFIEAREKYQYHKINQALEIYQNIDNLNYQVTDSNLLKQSLLQFNLGLCHQTLAEKAHQNKQQNQLAQEYFNNCLERFEALEREDLEAKFINNLGDIFLNLSNWHGLKKLAEEAISLHQKYNQPLQLAQAYGFLAQVALQQKQWQEAENQANLALATLKNKTNLPTEYQTATIPLRVDKGVYLLLLAQAEEYLNKHSQSFTTLQPALEVGVEGKPDYFLHLLKEIQELYFYHHHYLDAYQTKIEYQSIRQQYGLTAFVGAGRIKVSKTQAFSVSGRQGDVDNLVNRITSPNNRLTIIYGQSGVGKSSLVEAGLIPALQKLKRLDNRDIVIIKLRVYSNWQQELREKLGDIQTVNHNQNNQLGNVKTIDRIRDKLKENDANYQLTVLIFDQFEEFFFDEKKSQEIREFFKFLQGRN